MTVGSEILELARASSGVKADVVKTPKDAVSSLSGFQRFFLGVDTMPARGIVRVLWPKRRNPAADGALLRAIELNASARRKRCPKKYAPVVVVARAHTPFDQPLSPLKPTQPPRPKPT